MTSALECYGRLEYSLSWPVCPTIYHEKPLLLNVFIAPSHWKVIYSTDIEISYMVFSTHTAWPLTESQVINTTLKQWDQLNVTLSVNKINCLTLFTIWLVCIWFILLYMSATMQWVSIIMISTWNGSCLLYCCCMRLLTIYTLCRKWPGNDTILSSK